MAAKPPIIRRRVTIPFDPAKAERWHYDKREVEDLLNALSFVLPTGEKFFIKSVQLYMDCITDPALSDQVKRFIYQEAMHTKEHDRCNEALEKAYPLGRKIETCCKAILWMGEHLNPKASQLGYTCALEHFTALLAESLLVEQDWFIEGSDPDFASLWLWHAVEESEHKAVCFDVYRQCVGTGALAYLNRIATMLICTAYFSVVLVYAGWIIRRGRKKHPRTPAALPVNPPGVEIRSAGPLTLLNEAVTLRHYLDYYRPSFHPWNYDSRPLIARWKERYRAFGTDIDASH